MAATSLGGVESLVEHRYSIEGAGVPACGQGFGLGSYEQCPACGQGFGLGSYGQCRAPLTHLLGACPVPGGSARLETPGDRAYRLLGAQPRPRALQLAASNAAEFYRLRPCYFIVGVPEDLLRLSTGCEDWRDLLADLTRALDQAEAP